MDNQNLPQLLRQLSMARYLLLATVIATIVNMFLWVAQSEFVIPYCAILPYYLTILGYLFDGLTPGTYTVTGMILSLSLLSLWLLAWWKSKRRSAWLKVGLVLGILDTAILCLYAFIITATPSAFLMEMLLHGAVLYEIATGIKAEKQLRQFSGYEPTPTEMEYRDGIQ